MNCEQMTIWDIPLISQESKCLNCYYECKGKCASWDSKYEDMSIPLKGCEYYDGVSGGIPSYEELKGRYE